ncbi:MAG: hypothetical protein QOJ89_5505 [bacterium]|jgi:hypothetical protein
MFALLPILGGPLLGWLAPRKTAVALQLALYAVAIAVLTSTAPDHGGSYRDVLWIAPALAVVSAAALLLGFRFGRSAHHPSAPQR